MSDLALGAVAHRRTARAPTPAWVRKVAAPIAVLLALLAVWAAAVTLINPAPSVATGGFLPANWWNDRPIVPSPAAGRHRHLGGAVRLPDR